MLNPNSRNIPNPIKREVRQRCGFGCVVCGFPLYEYEHLLGWAKVRRHAAREITLLCDRHHRERTSGLLPIERVRSADTDPFNNRQGTSKPYDLNYEGTTCEAIIGGNRFTSTAPPLGAGLCIPVMIDGLAMVGFLLQDGHLLVDLNLFDMDNRRVMAIQRDQLVYSMEPWDIELKGRRLLVRISSRDILIDIAFEPPSRIVIERGRFLRNGIELLIRPTYTLVTNNANLLSQGTMVNCS